MSTRRVYRYGNACARLVLDYHPLHLFDSKTRSGSESQGGGGRKKVESVTWGNHL